MKNATDILLITPPFTQINSPYPAAPFLVRYLKSHGVKAAQADLSARFANRIYTRQFLSKIFDEASGLNNETLSANAKSVLDVRAEYENTVGIAVEFLKNPAPALSSRIINGNLFPSARYFHNHDIIDRIDDAAALEKSRVIATNFIADISAFISDTIDPNFSLSRYGERISQSPPTFAAVKQAVEAQNIITREYEKLLSEIFDQHNPLIAGVTIPFPGTLVNALRTLKFAAEKFPSAVRCAGGGYVNTELRNISDPDFFEYAQYLLFDDGEAPLLNLFKFIKDKTDGSRLVRTMYTGDGKTIHSGNEHVNAPADECMWPDYTGINFSDYIPMSDGINPMISLWNNEVWLKMTLAHGCYWKKCSFCDTSLDYICRFEPLNAKTIAERIEILIEQTGRRGFHFTDEAAPPALLRDLAIEILRRGISISWWTNIRFEKNFTADTAKLLALSGCIALSGGLEAACDRVLQMMNKGVTLADAAVAAKAMSESGILVHAYLIYGFPGQTEQEIVDSLEAVRQMFYCGIISSAYYHQFAMTRHSDVGRNPDKYQITDYDKTTHPFANNDVDFKTSICYSKFSKPLEKAMFNFNSFNALENPAHSWFDFKMPHSSIKPNYVESLRASQSREDALYIVCTCSGARKFSEGGKNFLKITDKSGEETFADSRKNIDAVYDIIIAAKENGCVKYSEAKNKQEFHLLSKSALWAELREASVILLV